MSNRVQQLSDTMQTTCPNCGSIFMLSSEHLEAARGQVRCGECSQVFNALLSLENYSGEFSLIKSSAKRNNKTIEPLDDFSAIDDLTEETVSLEEAMYGDDYSSKSNFKPILWLAGILLLTILVIIQVVYYQRYTLISSVNYQQQILGMCRILPCDESRFTSLSQIKLLDRNIFTHPTRKNALMVSGSFVNQAPFSQPVPSLLISLSDTKGKFIANRLFKAEEFLSDKSINKLIPGKPVQFRLEINDPGNDALAYEFEFFSNDVGD